MEELTRRNMLASTERNKLAYYPYSNVRNPVPYSHGIANAGISGMINIVKMVNRVDFFIPGGISSLDELTVTARHATALLQSYMRNCSTYIRKTLGPAHCIAAPKLRASIKIGDIQPWSRTIIVSDNG
jgi:hypothetical protein